MSKSLNTAFPARKLLRRLGLLSALLVLPTAVLAYADLLQGADHAGRVVLV